MSATVIVCGTVFDGTSDELTRPSRDLGRGQSDYQHGTIC